jgi:adenylylsulfate kinase
MDQNIIWQSGFIPREAYEQRNGHRGAVLWFTGLSGSGKSTLANALAWQLFEQGRQVYVLDGDNIRHGLCKDLGFDAAAREENIRRVGEVAKLFFEQGCIVLTAFISPYRADRDHVRKLFAHGGFHEIHTAATFDECAKRDPKGLYAKALRGEIKHFTGLTDPYEAPLTPELILPTGREDQAQSLDRLMRYLSYSQVLPPSAA